MRFEVLGPLRVRHLDPFSSLCITHCNNPYLTFGCPTYLGFWAPAYSSHSAAHEYTLILGTPPSYRKATGRSHQNQHFAFTDFKAYGLMGFEDLGMRSSGFEHTQIVTISDLARIRMVEPDLLVSPMLATGLGNLQLALRIPCLIGVRRTLAAASSAFRNGTVVGESEQPS